ncbi:sulfurtransferase TusA family protein [Vibrio sonorensis]|uniref:sulfurtransferase TusA family protein n=1 Tax=Vibrio sonorensis TaxID=1004316 RepID=UPI0008D9048D|nr:sulfurtransferase TusA family protein [Vibrio sonorensis]
MKGEKLDLRDVRCPLALLMVKRFVKSHTSSCELTIWLTDPASKKDIVRFLERQSYQVNEQKLTGYYALVATIGNSSNV